MSSEKYIQYTIITTTPQTMASTPNTLMILAWLKIFPSQSWQLSFDGFLGIIAGEQTTIIYIRYTGNVEVKTWVQ